MDIQVKTIDQVTVVAVAGDIDGNSAPEAQAQILPLAQPNAKIILDLQGVPFMSSAGLRLLLVIYRTLSGNGGKVALVGLSDDIADTMRLTGFLDFFSHHDSLDAGLAAVA
ncbi:MAG: anti-sigma factor antagonist [Caldilineaceae bacterium]